MRLHDSLTVCINICWRRFQSRGLQERAAHKAWKARPSREGGIVRAILAVGLGVWPGALSGCQQLRGRDRSAAATQHRTPTGFKWSTPPDKVLLPRTWAKNNLIMRCGVVILWNGTVHETLYLSRQKWNAINIQYLHSQSTAVGWAENALSLKLLCMKCR